METNLKECGWCGVTFDWGKGEIHHCQQFANATHRASGDYEREQAKQVIDPASLYDSMQRGWRPVE